MKYFSLFCLLILAWHPLTALTDRTPISQTHFVECDAQVKAEPGNIESYRCYTQVAGRHSQWDAARRRLHAIVARDPANDAARLFLAEVETELGKTAAEGDYRLAADGFRAKKNLQGLVLVYADLCAFYRVHGELEKASAALDAATAAAQQSGDALLSAETWIERGYLANSRSLYGQAWTYFKRAESVVFPSGPIRMQLSILDGLAGTTFSVGRIRESFDYFRRTADIYRSDQNQWAEARALYDVAMLGWQLYFLGDMAYDEANNLELMALECAIRSGNRSAEAYIRCLRAQDPAMNPTEAFEESRRALALSRQIGDISCICFALRILADNSLRLHPDNPSAAFQLCDQAIEMAKKAGDLPGIAWGWGERMTLRITMGDRVNFFDECRKTFETIERIRDLQRDEVVKAGFVSEWASFYYSAIGFLLDAPGGAPSHGDLEHAFSVIERLRARILLDSLDASHATAEITPSGSLHEKRQAVLDSIAKTQRQLLNGGLADEDVLKRLADIERLEGEEAALRDEMASHDLGFSALVRPSFARIEDVQNNLKDDEVLLSYQLSDRTDELGSQLGGSWLISVTREEARVDALPDNKEVEPAVRLFLGMIARRDGTEKAGAVRLYRDLLLPSLNNLPPGKTHVIIVPDRILHRLPFDALRHDEQSKAVGQLYEITIVPSATVWLRWRNEKQPMAECPALVLADPELGTHSRVRESGRSVDRQWALIEGHAPGPLPYARREGRALVRRLGQGSLALMGSDATEHALKTMDLSRYRILHFAAHAILDDEHPDRSAILLAPGAPAEDGLLQIREVVRLPLKGKVVVLASCRSASGTLFQGEGVMGLARGFLQAGAHAVIGSLWPLRDEDAQKFFDTFYRHLSNGMSLAGALAAARNDRIQDGAPPAAWAGIVLIGDGHIIPIPGGSKRLFNSSRTLVLLISLVFISMAVIATMAFMRGRRSEFNFPERT